MNNKLEDLEQRLRAMSLRPPPASLDTRILRPWRARIIPLAAVAALVVLAVIVTLFLLPSEQRPEQQELAHETDIEQVIAREGISAQLLATAELLAEEPEAYTMGLERFRQIINDYPDTVAATVAMQRLQNVHP